MRVKWLMNINTSSMILSRFSQYPTENILGSELFAYVHPRYFYQSKLRASPSKAVRYLTFRTIGFRTMRTGIFTSKQFHTIFLDFALTSDVYRVTLFDTYNTEIYSEMLINA